MKGLKHRFYTTDVHIFSVFNSLIKCSFLDRLMPKLTYIGGAVFTISICLSIIVFGSGDVRKMGIQALLTLTLSHIAVHFLKNFICRLRPKDALPDVNNFKLAYDRYSFPSGHTTAVFSIANTFVFYMPVLAVLCFPIALSVAVSRVYLGEHYPSDVLAGMGIALLFSAILKVVTGLVI